MSKGRIIMKSVKSSYRMLAGVMRSRLTLPGTGVRRRIAFVAMVTGWALLATLIVPQSAQAAVPPAVSTVVAANGDLVSTVPVAGVDQAALQNALDAAPHQGTLSDTIKYILDKYPVNGSAASDPSWPQFDGTVTAVGSAIVVTIPKSDVHTELAGWVISVIAGIVGLVAYLLGLSICFASFGPAAPFVNVICQAVGGFMAGFAATMTSLLLQDKPVAGKELWLRAVAVGIVGGLSAGAITALTPWAQANMRNLVVDVATSVGATVRSWATWIGSKAAEAGKYVWNMMTWVGNRLWGKIEDLFGAASASTSNLPCDVYDTGGTPCVAEVSMDRALDSYYFGSLYQVERSSDNATADIGLLTPGGYVDASQQDSFCAGTSCIVNQVYDQSFYQNNLTIEGAGDAGAANHGADAASLPITVGGHKAYGLNVTGQVGYRDNNADGTARNGQPEGMYMVASGTHVNDGCCFDFGNTENTNRDTGNGHMDAVNLGTKCYFPPCTGSGPWVEADMENGLFSGGNGSNLANKGNSSNFVTAMLKNDGQTTYALKGGDSQSGDLSTWYSGPLPDLGGYRPMQQEGGIVLGTGGDNSNASIGSFFEGVMTQGYPTDTADANVQAGIVAAGYAGSSGPAGPPAGGGGGGGGGAAATAGPAVAHEGYSSVYTVDASNNHLQETYLPAIGQPWATQDLSGNYGTPAVAPGTEPVALTHDGYTSVYTVDASNGHLQETFLPALGQGWATQDLSANYGTPQTGVTPTAVVHDGYTSVYTVDTSNGHLQETFLPALGQGWATQDLSTNYGTPQVLAGTSSVAVYHSGYTSVYTIDANHDLQETYLPAIGQRWTSQDLSANYGTPQSTVTPTAVVHAGYTSVYTVDQSNNDLQETYLPAIGQPWASQDLSANYGTPPVAPGTQPVALFHTGYTSVYTVDATSDHLQETYLPAIGQSWTTQDLSAKYGTPVTTRTPIVLLHADPSGALTWTSVYTFNQFDNHLQETYLSAIGSSWITQDLSAKFGTPARNGTDLPTAGWSAIHDGYTSVYTVDASNGHLQETYLPAMNQPWSTQDLSANYGTPAVRGGVAPVTLTHDGYTSVFTVDQSNNHLQETFLPAMGQPWSTQDLSANYGTAATTVAPTVAVHNGYTSVYTVDASNGHLQETYLSALGRPWIVQDLSANYGTPSVSANTSPVVVYHSGYTSVYTVDASNNHVQETYLPAIGAPWATQDLSAKYGTPTTNVSPAALAHDGYTSVYTVDASNSHLQETFLPAIGDPWTSQDLSTNYGAPSVASGKPPVALYHTGYASVYTVNASNGNLQETYLPSIGSPWTSQDLSAKYGTPPPNQAPSALLHYDTSGGLTFTSVFTVNASDQHLQETYLPAINQPWTTQDLSAKYGTPPV